jgi:hypothetical protein
MGNKSSKGSAFERELSKLLTVWVSGLDEPILFWRVPASGGMMTRNFHVGEAFSGDIRSLHPSSAWVTDIFSIEAKNGYPGASHDKHLKENKSDAIKSFWVQAVRDAEVVTKIPLLIYRKKGLPPWVGVTQEMKDLLDVKLTKSLRFVHLGWNEDDALPDIFFYDMKSFFEHLNPEDVKEHFKK